MIQVFSKPNCMACNMTKKWLKNNEIDFQETNVEEDIDALNYLKENGWTTLPSVFKDSELVALGFQPQNLNKLL